MSIAVQTDLVPRRGDLGCEGAMALHLLANEEEGGGCLRPREKLEDDRRSARIRTVVKGERDAVLMREATLDSQYPCQRGHVRCRRGRAPGAGRCEGAEAECAEFHARMVTEISPAVCSHLARCRDAACIRCNRGYSLRAKTDVLVLIL